MKEVEEGRINSNAQTKDLPIVIGSQRSFSTDNFAEILIHFAYTELVFAEVLKNSNPMQIFELLKQKHSYQILDSLSSLNLGLQEMQYQGQYTDTVSDDSNPVLEAKEDAKYWVTKGFKPVINLDDHTLLDDTGYKIDLWPEGLPEQRRSYE